MTDFADVLDTEMRRRKENEGPGGLAGCTGEDNLLNPGSMPDIPPEEKMEEGKDENSQG